MIGCRGQVTASGVIRIDFTLQWIRQFVSRTAERDIVTVSAGSPETYGALDQMPVPT